MYEGHIICMYCIVYYYVYYTVYNIHYTVYTVHYSTYYRVSSVTIITLNVYTIHYTQNTLCTPCTVFTIRIVHYTVTLYGGYPLRQWRWRKTT